MRFGDVTRPRTLERQEGGSHYKDRAIEPAHYILANNLDWAQGEIVKYITRHREKGGAVDLQKLIHYACMILERDYGIVGHAAYEPLHPVETVEARDGAVTERTETPAGVVTEERRVPGPPNPPKPDKPREVA